MELPNTPEYPAPLVLSGEGVESLAGAGRWTRRFAIMSIVLLCLCVPLLLCLSFIMALISPPVALVGFYLLCVAIVLLPLAIAPAIFLFRHSKNACLAAENCDGQRLERSLRNMRSFSTYLGICLIAEVLLTVAYWVVVLWLLTEWV